MSHNAINCQLEEIKVRCKPDAGAGAIKRKIPTNVKGLIIRTRQRFDLCFRVVKLLEPRERERGKGERGDKERNKSKYKYNYNTNELSLV